MSEKPEAWTAADSLIWPHLAAKLVREQHAEIERLKAENERLREALQGIAEIDFRNVDSISIWARLLLREVVDKAKAALRREGETSSPNAQRI